MPKLSLNQLQDKLKRLSRGAVLEIVTTQIILKDHKVIERKQDEFEFGRNPDGSIIGTYASKEYEEFKRLINPNAGGNVDLILTGSTRDKLRIDYLGNRTFRLSSGDEKWQSLVSKYGEQIQTISPEVFNDLQKTRYAPMLIAEMKRISGL